MRTLWEMAEIYERWAAEEEALADQMMAGLNQRREIQVEQREWAQRFFEEAGRFRQAAARLREMREDPRAGWSSSGHSSLVAIAGDGPSARGSWLKKSFL